MSLAGARCLARQMVEVGLRLHPDKTRIVYCRDGKRRGSYEHTSFTFLGYTFRALVAMGRDGERFSSFMPAMSRDAVKAKGREVRRWRLHLRTGRALVDLAEVVNPIVAGWMNYWPVSPVRALSSPQACQHLPGALGSPKV